MRKIVAVPFDGMPAIERGPVPELRWVEVALLRVDDVYQRPIGAVGAATIRKIVQNFDWRMFAPVVVCPVEGGVYSVVDGQHRTTAALMCDITAVPCLVIHADRQQQAKAFGAINGQVTKITVHALYRARLAAGDPAALAVKAVGEAVGIEILTYNPSACSLKTGQTPAVSAIMRVLDQYGQSLVEPCLRAMAASAAETPGAMRSMAVLCFVNVLADHAEWRCDPRLVEASALFDLRTEQERAAEAAKRKRMPTLPFLEAALITHYERELMAKRGAA